MRLILLFVIILLAVSGTFAQAADAGSNITRFDARPADGFYHPYYLYVPPALSDAPLKGRKHTILVIPNNTGKLDDDFSVHEEDVKRRIASNSRLTTSLNVAILIPVFPRPKSDWQTYIHALDRDSMLSAKKGYARPDLQLLAMIDDARGRLAERGLKFDKRVLMLGFSASGMFTNRFTFLHPDRVKAAAIGSPGGWPLAPADSYKDKELRYPIGTGDLRKVAGRKLDLAKLRKVPLFVFLGDKDENDSVPFGDSYDDEDRELIMPLLGKKPVDRWGISKSLYQQAGLNAEFKLYPGVEHTITPAIRDDILAFLAKHAN